MPVFAKRFRIRKTPDFKRVYEARKVVSDAVLVVFALSNERDYCRLGLAVSKKAGNAVVRNRWKRLIREAFRKNQARFADNPAMALDFVVLPQRGAKLPKSAQIIEKSLVKLVEKAQRRLER